MDKHLFNLLIQELQICKNEVVEKVEQIRVGIIDVENQVQLIINAKSEKEPPA